MFMSDEDLQSLTGYVRQAEQKRWLCANSVVFKLDRWGRPRVLRSEVERVLSSLQVAEEDEPNWDALRNVG